MAFRHLKCGVANAAKELNLSFYFILINFNLNSHMPGGYHIRQGSSEGEFFNGMELKSKSEFRGKCREPRLQKPSC